MEDNNNVPVYDGLVPRYTVEFAKDSEKCLIHNRLTFAEVLQISSTFDESIEYIMIKDNNSNTVVYLYHKRIAPVAEEVENEKK